MRRITLDANVLAPGFTSEGSASARLVNLWRAGGFTLILSNHILNELARTFSDPYFSTRLSLPEAAFWDTHDFTEFLDETRPVKLRVSKQLSEGLTVRLDRHDRQELERRAGELGVGPSTLVRMWIKERLRGTQRPSS